MVRAPLLLTLVLGGLLSDCSQSDSDEITAAELIAQNFSVTQEVLTSFQGVGAALRADCKRAGGSGAICSTYRISLINEGPASPQPVTAQR